MAFFKTNRSSSRVAYYIPNKFPECAQPSIQTEDDERQKSEVEKIVTALSSRVGGATVLGEAAGAYYSGESNKVEFENTMIVFSYSFDGISSRERLGFIELAVLFGKNGNQEEIIVEVGDTVYRILKSAYDRWTDEF